MQEETARIGQEEVTITIMRKKWIWIGHSLGKEGENSTRMTMTWNPQGKREQGRTKHSWPRVVKLKGAE